MTVDAGMNPRRLRVIFIVLWVLLQSAKILLAARLPLFVDEAFYAWEGRHLDWAYSDVPGLAAALTRLGTELGGLHALAMRAPFLLLGAWLPWLVRGIARRWFGERAGEQAGLLALAMPLSGLLGIMAVPDVPLVVAALLCVDAIARLRERVDNAALLQLALALAMGAFSHYRFAAVIVAGLAGLLLDPRGRALLRDVRIWLVLLVGALAWWPLWRWNLDHGGAGWRFQLLDRNPWSFHADGLEWLPIQFLLVTPPQFLLLFATLVAAWRRRDEAESPWRLIFGIAMLAVPGYFLLGFFADRERVSFHWPLAGWLVLVAAAPVLLRQWRPWARRIVWATAASALVLGLLWLAAASSPHYRRALAGTRLYPSPFAGTGEASDWLAGKRIDPGTPIIASDFVVGAQLAFHLDRSDIRVLDTPLNGKHGRAQQLQAWGAELDRIDQLPAGPAWLLIDDAVTPLKWRLQAYHRRCLATGRLPPPEILQVDHGLKRYLLYRIESPGRFDACIAPALAWVDEPLPATKVSGPFVVHGWAFKDGAGLDRVEVLLDGRSLGDAEYGASMPGVRDFWKISTDPDQPRVGFRMSVDASKLTPGRYWLGLRLHGRDGSIEDWPEQRLIVAPR
jgi:4-amino-4-deoxy-L-arabinose transferase-like glycosyltransferase